MSFTLPMVAPVKRVLLVHDDPTMRRMVTMAFATANRRSSTTVEVVEATSVAEAAALLGDATNRFDVALLDSELPDGTALDLLPALQAAAVAVHVLTARDGHDVGLFIDLTDGASVTSKAQLVDHVVDLRRQLTGV